MALRRLLGALCLLAALGAGCKGDDPAKQSPPGAASAAPDLRTRCEQLARACSDDKHVDKIVAECAVTAGQGASSCDDKAIAIYDCYQKELCGKSDQVWSLNDLRVLADRHGKCTAERDALRACVGK